MKTKQVPSTPHKTSKKLQERNLLATDPKKEQFAPTPAEPVRQRYRMAGGS